MVSIWHLISISPPCHYTVCSLAWSMISPQETPSCATLRLIWVGRGSSAELQREVYRDSVRTQPPPSVSDFHREKEILLMKAWRLQLSSSQTERSLQQLWRLNSQRTVSSFQGTAVPPPPICSVPGRLLDSSQLLIGNDSTASRVERLCLRKALHERQWSHSGVKRLMSQLTELILHILSMGKKQGFSDYE